MGLNNHQKITILNDSESWDENRSSWLRRMAALARPDETAAAWDATADSWDGKRALWLRRSAAREFMAEAWDEALHHIQPALSKEMYQSALLDNPYMGEG